MKRLTYWCPDGKGSGEWRANVRGTEVKGEEIDRLAAYEDTGLEPEKITGQYLVPIAKEISLGALRRLHELVTADKDGRIVVLPAAPGSVVYVIDLLAGEAVPCEVLCFSEIDGSGSMNMEYEVPREIPKIVSVCCGVDEIGKTVFLTREEAEAALEKEGKK